MDKHSIKVLEYDKIVSLISGFAQSDLGKKNLLKLSPLYSLDAIIHRQQLLQEVQNVFDSYGIFSLLDLKDLSKELNLASKGKVLTPHQLLDISYNLNLVKVIKRFLEQVEFLNLPRTTENQPPVAVPPQADKAVVRGLLSQINNKLVVFLKTEERINKSIDSDGKILDTASDKLRQIRKKIQTFSSKITEKLNQIIKDPYFSKFIQEPLITIRLERYVVPVKKEYKSNFPGIVLDQSASGVTLFIEPESITDLSNELSQLRAEEKEEENEILRQLSCIIGEQSQIILNNQKLLAELDFLRAIILWSGENKCSIPVINQKGFLKLIGARHPLIQPEKVVPIDIHLGDDFNILILTGPNTGGKTVTLKTAGLFVLMALSGLPILALPLSQIPYFKDVFADIGDEQSIAQNLSTFSSHLSQISRFLPKIDKNMLVLLDEIGAGTDPGEGAALAISVLEYLYTRGVKVIATTHYNDLKAMAVNYNNIQNACVEFDFKTLQPTYKVKIGQPGPSCAFIVAEHLGLSAEIINCAKSKVDQVKLKTEDLLRELQEEKESLSVLKSETQTAKEDYLKKISNLEAEKEKILEETKNQTAEVFKTYQTQLEYSYVDFDKKTKSFLKSRPDFLAKRKEIKSEKEKISDFIKTGLKNLAPDEKENLTDFNVGEKVALKNSGKIAKILEIYTNGEILVQTDQIKYKTLKEDLEKVKSGYDFVSEKIENIKKDKLSNFSTQLNVRGLNTDEAIYRLEKYLDDCLLCEVPFIRIVHGKGTGTLRKAIWEYLKNHKRVKNIRLGELSEGSWGATVVELKV